MDDDEIDLAVPLRTLVLLLFLLLSMVLDLEVVSFGAALLGDAIAADAALEAAAGFFLVKNEKRFFCPAGGAALLLAMAVRCCWLCSE